MTRGMTLGELRAWTQAALAEYGSEMPVVVRATPADQGEPVYGCIVTGGRVVDVPARSRRFVMLEVGMVAPSRPQVLGVQPGVAQQRAG